MQWYKIYGVGAKKAAAQVAMPSPQPPTKIPVIHAHHIGGNQAEAAQVVVAIWKNEMNTKVCFRTQF